MDAYLSLEPQSISAGGLVEISKNFYTTYRIEFLEADERFLRNHIKDLHTGRLEYRFGLSAKFFCERSGRSTRLHGYAFPGDPEPEEKSKKFAEILATDFEMPPEKYTA